MKQRLPIILLLISAISITFAGCDGNDDVASGGASPQNAGIDILAPGDRDPGTEGNLIKGTGRIVYNSFEGGFYGIAGDDGQNYYADNLPDEFKHSGLTVTFEAYMYKIQETHVIWGVAIHLVKISSSGSERDK